MNKFKLIVAAVLASTMGMTLASCGAKGSITSFKMSEVSKKTVGVGKTITLKVSVSVDGDASDEVEWSIDKADVAEITPNGKECKVKGLKPGSIVVSVKSKFDNSKTASINLDVIELGPHPELIDAGYEYVLEWPSAQIKEFAGVDVPKVEIEDGVYFMCDPNGNDDPEEGWSPYFEILMDYTDEYYYAIGEGLESAHYHYYYNDYYGQDGFIDPTKAIEVDLGYDFLDEEYQEPVLIYNVYKTADVWGSSKNTSDTAWNKDIKDVLDEMELALPFVKLGEDYDYDDSDGLYIYDFCADFDKLNNYGAALKGAGFEEKGSEEEGFYYSKVKDDFSEFVVYFGFGSYGNFISAYENLRELETFPLSAITLFAQGHDSKFTVPQFEGSDKVRFTFYEGQDEEKNDFAQVGIYNSTEQECYTYVQAMKSSGFVAQDSEEPQLGYEVAKLQKGKLCVEAVMSYMKTLTDEEEIEEYFDQDIEKMSDEEYELYMDNLMSYYFGGDIQVPSDELQEAWMTITIDKNGIEDPGVYYKGSGERVAPGEDIDVSKLVVVFDLPGAVLSYSSDATEVATVDASSGVVHGVADGTANITVSDGDGHSCVIPVKVSTLVAKQLPIAAKDIGSTSSYAACDGDHTIGGYVINSSNVSNNSGIQFKKNCPTNGLANKTAFEDGLISIEIKGTDQLTVYFGESGASMEPVTPVAKDGSYVYTAPEGAKYFAICNASAKVAVASSITINYFGK